MTENELRITVLLCSYQGMIGNISKDLRMITIDWGFKFYKIRAVYDRPITDDDRDDIGVISAEVLASVSTMVDCKEEVEYSNLPIMDLPRLGKVIFLRKGEL